MSSYRRALVSDGTVPRVHLLRGFGALLAALLIVFAAPGAALAESQDPNDPQDPKDDAATAPFHAFEAPAADDESPVPAIDELLAQDDEDEGHLDALPTYAGEGLSLPDNSFRVGLRWLFEPQPVPVPQAEPLSQAESESEPQTVTEPHSHGSQRARDRPGRRPDVKRSRVGSDTSLL